MTCPAPSHHADDLIIIAKLAMGLGQVERITRHPDGVTPETDTTHSLMLALICLTVAPRYGLDGERMAALALIHDLPEVYAGDTPTARVLSRDAAAEKDARERAATARLIRELEPSGDVLIDLLDEYRDQRTREARAVRLLDKVMPPLTVALNGGASLKEISMGIEELEARNFAQRREFNAVCGDMPGLLDLLRSAHALSERTRRGT